MKKYNLSEIMHKAFLERRGNTEYTQGTVTAPPGYQRAFQALSLPSHPGKF